MKITARIITNIRDQAVLSYQIDAQLQEVEKYRSQHSKLIGALELLQVMFMEEQGIDINQYMTDNESFRDMIADAREEGRRIAAGNPTPSIKMAQPKTEEKKTVTTGVTKHTSNRPKLVKKEESETVIRKREPPKILVDDNPPTPESGDPED